MPRTHLATITITLLLLGCGETLGYVETTVGDPRVPVDTGTGSVHDTASHTGDSADATAPETEVADVEDAEMVSWDPPSSMDCGETVPVRVVVRNSGNQDWSHDAGHKLGAVSDSDPFYKADTRVWLPEGTVVPAGDTWRFEFDLTAPEIEGIYTTDWQMVHENVQWFGETLTGDITVTCPQPSGEWVPQHCARNGSEVCDDESFQVDSGVRYALYCSEAEGGVSFISSEAGPEMSDGVGRCQGWEEQGLNAWDYLTYVAKTQCNREGDVLEVDLSAYVGGSLWFGSHDNPDGSGTMTSTCLATWEE